MHLEGGGLEEEKSVDDSNFSYTAPSEDGGTTVKSAGSGAKGAKSGNPAKSGKKAKSSAAAAAAQQATPVQQQAAQASRGAFGQQVEGEQADPTNRAERRKKK